MTKNNDLQEKIAKILYESFGEGIFYPDEWEEETDQILNLLSSELDRARKEEREIVIKEIEIKNSPSYKASVDYDRQLDSQTK